MAYNPVGTYVTAKYICSAVNFSGGAAKPDKQYSGLEVTVSSDGNPQAPVSRFSYGLPVYGEKPVGYGKPMQAQYAAKRLFRVRKRRFTRKTLLDILGAVSEYKLYERLVNPKKNASTTPQILLIILADMLSPRYFSPENNGKKREGHSSVVKKCER